MNTNYFQYRNNFKKYENVKSILSSGNAERNNIKFTIAIPTYNRPLLLEKSLESAINQINVKDYEIIIVDNDRNSILTPKLIELCKDEKVCYFRNQENIGMFGNWNRCIELSKGEYITILSDDDWLSEDYLSTCLMYLNKGIDGLYFSANVVDNRDKNISEQYLKMKKFLKAISKNEKKLTLFDFFLGNTSIGTLGILFKTDLLKELGGYNEEYFPSSDYVLHANYCNKYFVKRINRRLNYYRIEENESCKQETLRKWEVLDYDIRNYFITILGKNKRVLKHMNELLQHNRVEGLIKYWHYERDYEFKHNVERKAFDKLIAVKNYLNL